MSILFIKYDIKNYYICSNFPETKYLNLGLIFKTVNLNLTFMFIKMIAIISISLKTTLI